MTTDTWVNERARTAMREGSDRCTLGTWADCGGHACRDTEDGCGARLEAIVALGQECIERTRAEERAHATKALKLAHEMQDKAVASAVAAERERCEGYKAETEILRDAWKADADTIKRLREERDALQAAILDHPLPKSLLPSHCQYLEMARDLHEARRGAKMRAEAAEAKLARLENPDEALVEAVCEAMEMCDNPYCSETLGRTAIRALAAELTGQENTDG